MYNASLAEGQRNAIVNRILTFLYHNPMSYWNTQILNIMSKNTASLGRGKDGVKYSILFRNKRWTTYNVTWTDPPDPVYCLPLNEAIPEIKDRMEELADEMGELIEEHYEVRRFLINLVLFSMPPERYKKILGSTIFRAAETEIQRYAISASDSDWTMNSEFSLKTFVEKNMSTIRTMNSRVLLNVITQK